MDLNKMEMKLDKLTRVFTNIVNELESQVETLKGGIAENEKTIHIAQQENETYARLIEERQALKDKVESILK